MDELPAGLREGLRPARRRRGPAPGLLEPQPEALDYLLLDYCFAVARRHVPAVAELVESVPPTAMGPLGRCLTEPFDPAEWERFCRDYDFHKLSYKTPPRRFTPDGRKTYYGHVLELFLDEVPQPEKTERK